MQKVPKDTVNYDDFYASQLLKRKVLVIDDSVENIKLIGRILKQEGFEVLTASNPAIGVNIAETKLPDLILLDIMMQEMDGFKVCERLKQNKRTSEIPIIFLTALADDTNIVKAFDEGAVDYISKPFNKNEMVARLKTHLKLKISNEQTKALFESVYQTYITLNRELKIIGYNNIANVREESFNKKKLKLGDNIFNYINSKDHPLFKRKIEGVFQGKTAMFERHYVIDGSESWFNYLFEPIINNQGDIIGCLINGTDITEKKGFELRVRDYTSQLKEVYLETKQSLEFASYIQNSIFPAKKEFVEVFDDHFLIYKPKDVVSGDFYWLHNTGHKTIMVIGDCTGHGVPGALLTTISVLLLERIIKHNNITSPDEILNEIDLNLKDTLRKIEGGINNSLELAVCTIDNRKKILECSGAGASILLVKEDKLTEIKGANCDLGDASSKNFKKHTIQMAPQTKLYLFTDGITDQLGGEKRKRFMKKNLFKLIESICGEKMTEQKNIFEHSIKEWMQLEQQTDDMTLIGLQLS